MNDQFAFARFGTQPPPSSNDIRAQMAQAWPEAGYRNMAGDWVRWADLLKAAEERERRLAEKTT